MSIVCGALVFRLGQIGPAESSVELDSDDSSDDLFAIAADMSSLLVGLLVAGIKYDDVVFVRLVRFISTSNLVTQSTFTSLRGFEELTHLRYHKKFTVGNFVSRFTF